MHKTAYRAAEKFVVDYLPRNHSALNVLDIGSLDVNGSMRGIFANFVVYEKICKNRSWVQIEEKLGENF